jgi:hypothetical protein
MAAKALNTEGTEDTEENLTLSSCNFVSFVVNDARAIDASIWNAVK